MDMFLLHAKVHMLGPLPRTVRKVIDRLTTSICCSAVRDDQANELD